MSLPERYTTEPTEAPNNVDQPYVVYWVPQIPGSPFWVRDLTLDQADLLVDTLAYYDMFLMEERVRGDYANMGGVMEWDDDDQEWVDVDDMDLDARMGRL